MILSTCNRVEITVTTEDDVDPQAVVTASWRDHKAVELRRHRARTFTGTKAATPSTTFSAWPPAWIPWWSASRRSSDSSRPPTPRPRTAASLCGWLDGLMTRSFNVAKRVRSETGIGQMAVSVSYAAVELARKIFGTLQASRTV